MTREKERYGLEGEGSEGKQPHRVKICVNLDDFAACKLLCRYILRRSAERCTGLLDLPQDVLLAHVLPRLNLRSKKSALLTLIPTTERCGPERSLYEEELTLTRLQIGVMETCREAAFHVLIEVQPAEARPCYIFADWTPFTRGEKEEEEEEVVYLRVNIRYGDRMLTVSCKPARPVAKVYWCAEQNGEDGEEEEEGSIASRPVIQVDAERVRGACKSALKEGRSQVRLTGHVHERGGLKQMPCVMRLTNVKKRTF